LTVLSPSWTTVRLFLHVIAATIWVGGQLVLVALVRPLRALSPDAPRVAARHFNRVAWPAFGLLVVTGVWNVAAEHVTDTSSAYQVTLLVKLLVVALSGVGAFLHTQADGRKLVLALGGALAGVGALVALYLGVLLHTH